MDSGVGLSKRRWDFSRFRLVTFGTGQELWLHPGLGKMRDAGALGIYMVKTRQLAVKHAGRSQTQRNCDRNRPVLP